MKRIWITIALVIPFMIGCSDSIVNPESPTQLNSSQKSWIVLPQNAGMTVESDYSASNIIDGGKGGEVNLNINYKTKSSDHVKIQAKIKIPSGAFEGEENISMTINNNNGTVTFYPDPMAFNVPLIFSLDIQGLDLNEIDPGSLDFVCLEPDGSTQSVEYKKIKVKVNKGELEVDEALITHFSIYGWTR
jgi:hypothetical protein